MSDMNVQIVFSLWALSACFCSLLVQVDTNFQLKGTVALVSEDSNLLLVAESAPL